MVSVSPCSAAFAGLVVIDGIEASRLPGCDTPKAFALEVHGITALFRVESTITIDDTTIVAFACMAGAWSIFLFLKNEKGREIPL